MRILLVGNAPAATAALPELFAGSPLSVTQCAGCSHAMIELRKAWWNYDWVILGNRELLKEAGMIVGTVEGFGLPVPVGFIDAEGGTSPTLSFICATQRSADGLQLLRCTLAAPGAVRIDYRGHSGEEVIFEYRAPSQKEEKTAGPVLVIQGLATEFAAERLNCA